MLKLLGDLVLRLSLLKEPLGLLIEPLHVFERPDLLGLLVLST